VDLDGINEWELAGKKALAEISPTQELGYLIQGFLKIAEAPESII
jgi:hypothetical protein